MRWLQCLRAQRLLELRLQGQEDSGRGENPGEAVLTGGAGISEYIAGVQLGRSRSGRRIRKP